MSQKINSKNLAYTSSLPPFLAALHAQAAGAEGPDPILTAQRRSVKKRSGSEEAEDAPLVVDEEGNAVGYDVDKDGTVRDRNDGGEDGGEKVNEGDGVSEKREKAEGEGKAAIGGRKRKVGKVVGDAAEEAGKNSQPAEKSGKKEVSAEKKPKKRAKKIKLSFDEEEG